MSTLAPPLSRHDFVQSLFLEPAAERDLANPWLKDAQSFRWYSRTACAWRYLADHMAIRSGARTLTIWLPDYFCNQSTIPLRAAGHVVVFYRTVDGMRPDWGYCESLASSVPPDLFVLVHYFGVQNDLSGARAFADRQGAKLVEDATHCVELNGDMGKVGDVVSVSPYKQLALPDGALLIVNNGGNVPDGPPVRDPHAAKWALKRLLQTSLPTSVLEKRVMRLPDRFLVDPPTDPAPDCFTMSSLSKRLLTHYISNGGLQRAATRRRENADAYRSRFRNLPGSIECMPDTESAPYRWWTRFKSAEDAERVFVACRSLGCPVDTWPDLPLEVRENAELYEMAIQRRETTVFFPVHHGISPSLIERWAARLKGASSG